MVNPCCYAAVQMIWVAGRVYHPDVSNKNVSGTGKYAEPSHMGDNVEAYDFIFLALLAVSCFAGFVRGGTKELVNLISFFLALFIAIVSKGFITRAFHLDTITGYMAAFIVFLIVYFGVRYLGHALSDKMQKQKALNTFDRILGVGIGIFRTLVVLGVFHLFFSVVTPIDRQPHWFRAAKVYPLSVKCAKIIQAFIPTGTGAANKVVEDNQ
jgi:membrane protein required for colicin V production